MGPPNELNPSFVDTLKTSRMAEMLLLFPKKTPKFVYILSC